MNDEIDFIQRVIAVLEQMGVAYVIGGSVALTIWATPRMTHDLDVVVDIPEERVAEFCGAFPIDRYTIDAVSMRDAFRARNSRSMGMYSFTDMESGFKADLFPLRAGDLAQVSAMARRTVTEIVDGHQGAVYSPEDLLVQKIKWYALSESMRQFQDCLALLLADKERSAPMIDYSRVDEWVRLLGKPEQQAWAALKLAVDQAG